MPRPPPPLQYVKTAVLRGPPSPLAPVTALSFSPGGTRLACASYDQTIVIWETTGFESLLYRVSASAPALTLLWFSESVLICGMANGTMFTLVEMAVRFCRLNCGYLTIPTLRNTLSSSHTLYTKASSSISQLVPNAHLNPNPGRRCLWYPGVWLLVVKVS